jgi:preprotein translocase subunit SecF
MDWLKNWLTESNFDFVGRAPVAAMISLIMVVVSIGLFVFVGPRWGIDFTGGTEVHLSFEQPIEIGELRDVLVALDIPSDAVQEVGSEEGREFKIRIQDPEFGAAAMRTEVEAALVAGFGQAWIKEMNFSAEVGARFSVIYNGARTVPSQVEEVLAGVEGVRVEEGREDSEIIIKLPGLSAQVTKQIATAMGERKFTVEAVDAVGPKVGESLRQQGFVSLFATLGLILVYVAFRFDLAFAPGAVIALFHDVTVTVGIFILLDKEFNLAIVGALLTIIGYSLNDTIVIYDRIRENRERYRRQDLLELINVSINETLARTVGTAVTTFFAIAPFLFVGNEVIGDFVLAMMCGIVFGTYSTVYVASPMIVVMERFRPYIESLVALPPVTEEEEVPADFLSETEKRRRERDRLVKDRREDDNEG